VGATVQNDREQDYREMTRQELYRLAQERDIPGRSRLSKHDLVEALELDDVGPDAVSLVLAQHDEIRALFATFGELSRRPSKKKQKLVHEIVTYLMRHAQVEEQVFYPAVRAELPDLSFEVDEDLEEHHLAEILLSEVEAVPASSPRYDAKIAVLIENVSHHLDEEEEQLLPRVRDEFDEVARRELGAAMREAWLTVPIRPQVHVADGPALQEEDAVAAEDLPRTEADVGEELVADAAAADDALAEDDEAGSAVGDTVSDTDTDTDTDTHDDAMTRSEEELQVVGTRTRETGKARLRKQVVTEHVTETVPVQREEAVVEREPITDANRDDAMDGPRLTEDEREVTLHEEEPVAEKRTVPKERVRLGKHARTDRDVVAGDVAREDIEVVIDHEAEGDGADGDEVIDLAGLEAARQEQGDR
jgi:uncharacterized protein (TIGR02271 family)